MVLNDTAARGRVGARDMILAGPRGIGKTAALLAFGDVCREAGYEVVNLQAAAGNAGMTDSLVAEARERIQAGAGAWHRAQRAFELIAGVNLSVAGFGAGLTTRQGPESPRVVSPGELARALAQLSQEVHRDAPTGGVLITIDEMQVAPARDLALIAAALQRLNADHPDAVVLFAGSGLPHMPQVLIDAGVTHPDRLFRLQKVPLTLSEADALFAIVEPARARGVSWDPDAAQLIVAATNGYPAHLQIFADHAWRAAETGATSITVAHAQQALETAAAELEERTLGPRFDRLTDRQQELLAALALHGGTARTADITAVLGRPSQAFSRIRDELITEGDVYAPRRGELAMTVPLFAPYLLAHYEEARGRATNELLSLAEMRRRQTPSANETAEVVVLPSPASSSPPVGP